jgi:hypothetical protein
MITSAAVAEFLNTLKHQGNGKAAKKKQRMYRRKIKGTSERDILESKLASVA